ncbi:bifunctional metallophosphatase/5'-nucleotidase [Paenibacillus sp. TRM 82003]|nr:bifunctional metallophosphatase/5'-nucleotidase [Paenibacillus sp. TRM 82003]
MRIEDERMEFLILHTNDIHSVFESMPRLLTMMREMEREQPRERLLRFDIGDHMDRMRIETEGTLGEANIDVMNLTGYDAAVPGNNEGLTLTAGDLDRLYGELARFPVVATNLKRQGAPSGDAGWNLPSVVLERDGIRFGVIGLTAAYDDFYRELGWDASDPFPAAAAEVARLRGEGRADVVVALSHLGLSYDRRLAAETPGIDLILGGHTHHLFESLERIGNTYLGACGKFGSHLGVVRLTVDRTSRRMIGCEGGALETATAAPESALAARIESLAEGARATLERTLATLDVALPAGERGESPLGNLAAAALRRHCDAELGIVNSGQLLDGLEPGTVTAARLHAICPSPVNPCVMLLKGEELLRAVEESFREEFIYKVIRGYGFRGKVLGGLCLDGATIEAADGPDGRRVLRMLVNGEPLQPNRLYRVGSIDMFTFRIGYESLAEGRQVTYFLPEFLRDLLERALTGPESGARISEAMQPRVRIVDCE